MDFIRPYKPRRHLSTIKYSLYYKDFQPSKGDIVIAHTVFQCLLNGMRAEMDAVVDSHYQAGSLYVCAPEISLSGGHSMLVWIGHQHPCRCERQ